MKTDRAMNLFMTEITVRDLHRAVTWYVETLRLQVEMVDELRGFALLAAGAGKLALKQNKRPNGSGVRLVFEVADIDEEVRRLRGQVLDLPEVVDDAEGFRSLRLKDADGTPITLFAWSEKPG